MAFLASSALVMAADAIVKSVDSERRDGANTMPATGFCNRTSAGFAEDMNSDAFDNLSERRFRAQARQQIQAADNGGGDGRIAPGAELQLSTAFALRH